MTCSERMEFIKEHGTDFDQKVLQNEIHTAYLEKEIEKMYDRLAQTGRDTGVVSEKLAELKKRKKEMLK